MARKLLYLGATIILLQGSLLTGIGFCFDNAHLQQLNATNKCEKCDLTKADFSGLDMYGARLVGSNLSGANLSDASFIDANLSDANLTGANIKGATCAGAKLSNTTWVDGKKCSSGSVGKCSK